MFCLFRGKSELLLFHLLASSRLRNHHPRKEHEGSLPAHSGQLQAFKWNTSLLKISVVWENMFASDLRGTPHVLSHWSWFLSSWEGESQKRPPVHPRLRARGGLPAVEAEPAELFVPGLLRAVSSAFPAACALAARPSLCSLRDEPGASVAERGRPRRMQMLCSRREVGAKSDAPGKLATQIPLSREMA